MALIKYGKKEIEELEHDNEKLRNELKTLEIQCSSLREQVVEKDKKLLSFHNYIKQIESLSEEYEKLLEANRNLSIIVNNPDRKSKATTENIKVIADLKAQGKSYRSIAKVLSESSGKHFSYSTVRYLYKKYIENGEQRNWTK